MSHLQVGRSAHDSLVPADAAVEVRSAVPSIPGRASIARLSGAVLASALAFIALCLVAQTLLVSWLDHIPAPFGDEWDSIALFQRFRAAPSFDLLFSLHNEHRIAFPRLLFWSDYAVFDGTGTIDVAATFVILALEACLFAWLARRVRPRGTGWVAVAATTTALLFSMQQSENFMWAFQTQFVGVFAAASLACAVFARAAGPDARRAGWALAAALGLCFVATFTMANGVLVGPALVAMAVAARLPRRFGLRPGLLTAVLLAAYVGGFARAPGGPPTLDHLDDASRVLTNWCRYLGGFVEQAPGLQAALGASGLVWAAWAWGRALWLGERDSVRVACLGIAAFAAASAALTALGRSAEVFGDIGASRYVMGAATFWCAMLVHGWSEAAEGARLRPGAKRPAGTLTLTSALPTSTAAAVLLVSVIGAQATAVVSARDGAYKRKLVEDALLLGLHDAGATGDAGEVSDEVISRQIPFLRAHGISLFADRDARLIGMPLAAVGRLAGADCGGDVALQAMPSIGDRGVRAHGTTPASPRWPRLGRLYLADPAGRVVGLGTKAPESDGWRGFALALPGDRLSAYALSPGGRLCRIGEGAVAPGP